MKKVSLLILLVIVVSALLTAAIPTKLVRLTVINKSGDDVFIKLTGSPATDAYYYLTIPAGDRDNPTVKVFTVWVDLYDRETWQCGTSSTGQLLVDGNIRLVFTPCFDFLPTHNQYFYKGAGPLGRTFVSTTSLYVDLNGNGKRDPGEELWFRRETLKTMAGEPTQEKIVRFRYLSGPGLPEWANSHLYTGYFNWGCATWYWRARTYSRPNQCGFRYQY